MPLLSMTFFCKSRPDQRQRLPVSDRRRSNGRYRRCKGPPKPESEARGRRPAHSGPRPAFSEAGRARGQFLRSPMLRIKTGCAREAAHLCVAAHLRVGGAKRARTEDIRRAQSKMDRRTVPAARADALRIKHGRTGGCAADKARPHGRSARAAVRRRPPVIPQDSAPTGAPTARAAAPNPSTSRT